MIIDCHTHLFPPDIRKNREDYFPGEPAFELLYKPEKSRLAGAEDILSAMDEDRVDISVVFGFPWADSDLIKRHNDYIIEKVGEHPKRLLGFACFDVYSENAPKEAERCLNAGLSGIGELAFYRSGIDQDALSRLSPIMALAREANVPVLIHTNEPVGHYYPGKTPITLAQIWDMVTRFAENKIILAHWGGGIFFYNTLKRQAKEALGKVFFDTAASPYLYDDSIYRLACQAMGPEKILFGSDYPLLRAKRYFRQLDQSGPDSQSRKKILGANAASLLGIKTD